MADHPPERSIDLPPAAHHAVQALSEAATAPANLLISGGIGTGKTTVLSAARGTRLVRRKFRSSCCDRPEMRRLIVMNLSAGLDSA